MFSVNFINLNMSWSCSVLLGVNKLASMISFLYAMLLVSVLKLCTALTLYFKQLCVRRFETII